MLVLGLMEMTLGMCEGREEHRYLPVAKSFLKCSIFTSEMGKVPANWDKLVTLAGQLAFL